MMSNHAHLTMEAEKSPSGHTAQSSRVGKRYEGTQYDRHDMRMLGKKQVLRRQFRFSTMLGFASTVMVAWEFVLIVAPFGLTNGGTPAVFWGILLSPFVLLPVYASLAEVASMGPTAGGKRRPSQTIRTFKTLTRKQDSIIGCQSWLPQNGKSSSATSPDGSLHSGGRPSLQESHFPW